MTVDDLTPTTTTSVTFTAVLIPSVATGTVTFFAGSASLGTATLSSGIATLAHTFPIPNTYSITAAYCGDSTFAASTSTNLLSISTTLTGTTTTLQASTTTTTTATAVTLTATVTCPPAYLPASSGTVTFLDGGIQIGTGTVNAANGKATLDVIFSAAGSHSLTARYEQNSTYSTSTSSTTSITVTP